MCVAAQKYAIDQFGGRVSSGAAACTPAVDAFGRRDYLPSTLAALFGVTESSEPRIFAARIAAVCDGSTYRFAKPEVREIVGSRVKSYSERIDHYRGRVDAALESERPMPVLVRYCANVLINSNSTGVDPEDGKWDSDLCNKAGDPSDHLWHASTIIGRRCTSNGREYLIKNSWGTSCRGYDSGLQCDGGKLWVRGCGLISQKSERRVPASAGVDVIDLS